MSARLVTIQMQEKMDCYNTWGNLICFLLYITLDRFCKNLVWYITLNRFCKRLVWPSIKIMDAKAIAIGTTIGPFSA